MSIGHIQEKIKEILRRCEKRDIYTPFVIVLVGVSSFFLGRISATEAAKPPVLIETVNMPKEPMIGQTAADKGPDTGPKGKYVASKTGKKYHLPSCAGAKSIALENRIWFATKEEAEKAGLTPASNCKGI